ncbi:MAG: transketolase [Planctomycetes bacterium]|nr:transketolase [Planctomycetota bacterium]
MSTSFGSDRTGEDLEQLCCDAIRVLAMDAVEAAGCGHPGMPMGMADAAHVLWTQFLRIDPQDPNWLARDRFVLSAGHGSMLLYSLLHLGGFGLTLDDLKSFRQPHSKTPGHPENFETPGVETTTGPLGQGFSNGVGMAMAERHLAARFPDLSDAMAHTTYVIAGDGDLMEGVASEAASLAGHLGLGRLVVLYDDNQITIDGRTDISFTEDVLKRFDAYGWATSRIDGHDRAAVQAALTAAQGSDRPVLIACRTIIGKGAPTKQDTSGIHGSKLGSSELQATKEKLGWPQDAFLVPDAVRARWKERQSGWSDARQAWNTRWSELSASHADASAELDRWLSGKLDLSAVSWPTFEVGAKIATRGASGQVINALAAAVPNLISGSADLAGSVKTDIKGSEDFQANNYAGRNIRYGVREHAMAAAMNGIALHGGLIPIGGTFLVFSDYSRPSIRLSALMKLHAIQVLTHDSVFLGEDGPTHQPVEHYMALRAIPQFNFWRPADARETAVAWRCMLERKEPHGISLTRQSVPVLEGTGEGARRGGYVVADSQGEPDLILIATGSEVSLAIEVAQSIKDISCRVVSIPCWEVFDEQGPDYRDEILPPTCGARVSIESGVTFGWDRYVGGMGMKIGIDRFGASAPLADLQKMFGMTCEQVVSRVRTYLSDSVL